MKTVNINLYSFSELSKEAQNKAVNKHLAFMEMNRHEWEEGDEFTEDYAIENIEMNDYLFFKDGSLAHCVTYTDSHQKTGTTEFNLHGETFVIN